VQGNRMAINGLLDAVKGNTIRGAVNFKINGK
jgi:hypothetical protein